MLNVQIAMLNWYESIADSRLPLLTPQALHRIRSCRLDCLEANSSKGDHDCNDKLLL
jgi:hypothetical protein